MKHTQFTEVAHHFIGFDVKTSNGIGKLIGIVKDEAFVDYRGYTNKGYVDEFGTEYDFIYQENEYLIQNIKPICKPLSKFKDINVLDFSEINCDLSNQIEIMDLANKQLHYSSANFETVRLCLENRIDVFNLFESGQAVEATNNNAVAV